MTAFSQSDEVVAEMQRTLLRYWVESTFITIPLLGIRFSIADASVIGPLALTVLAIWLFYNFRRENHLIGQTLRDAVNEQQETHAFVYHGICSTQVFATLSHNDAPFRTIDGAQESSLLGVRWLSRVLIYLPAIAIGIVILSDFLSIFWLPAVFREGHQPLWSRLTQHPEMLLSILFRELIAMGFGVITGALLWRTSIYQDGTIAILHKVADKGWSTIVAESEQTS